MIEKKTKLLLGSVAADIAEAGRILREGGTVILPTETVYGLGANACDAAAVSAIFAAKGRPQDNPLIVHLTDVGQLPPLVCGELPPQLYALASRFWPGPLTVILPKSDAVPPETAGGLATVALRLPSHPVARAVLAAAGVPVAAPSANRSGSPSPTTVAHCVDDMWGRVDAIVDGGDCTVGVESTVLTLCTDPPRLLRPGAVTLEQLRAVLGAVEVDPGVMERLADTVQVSSPGMKYKHYAPRAQVSLVCGSSAAYAAYMNQGAGRGAWALCFDEELPLLQGQALSYGAVHDHAAQATALFGQLRELDRLGATRAVIHAPDTDGVGLAVYNRLVRAAGFSIINLE